MNIIAIIQCRMGSTRLPGKMLKEIDNRSILELITHRVSMSNLITDIIIATTTNQKDDIIQAKCKSLNYKCFRGSEDDVLQRVHDAAIEYNADLIVDLTGDCPLIDYKHIDTLIEYFNNYIIDYVSNCEERTFPDGFDVQVMTIQALKKINKFVTNPIHRSHTGWNITQFPDLFDRAILIADEKLHYPHWGLTLDEPADLVLIEKIFKHFGTYNYFSCEQIIEYLKDNPELLEINSSVKRKEPGNG